MVALCWTGYWVCSCVGRDLARLSLSDKLTGSSENLCYIVFVVARAGGASLLQRTSRQYSPQPGTRKQPAACTSTMKLQLLPDKSKAIVHTGQHNSSSLCCLCICGSNHTHSVTVGEQPTNPLSHLNPVPPVLLLSGCPLLRCSSPVVCLLPATCLPSCCVSTPAGKGSPVGCSVGGWVVGWRRWR